MNLLEWRLPPKVSFTNWKADEVYGRFYLQSNFRSWLRVERFWRGKIVNITVRHFQISLDFRANWLADMHPKAKP